MHRMHIVSVHFSHTCLLRPRPRSVLTGKFAGEEDGDVERDRFTNTLRRGVLAGASRGVAAECVESAGVLRGTRDAFGNWRARFNAEPQPPVRQLLYRR